MQASLFVPCLVDQFHPEVAEATALVLSRAGVELDYPRGQTCCGQPQFKTGHRRQAAKLARRFIALFERSPAVVAPSGSCVNMVRCHYPTLFAGQPAWQQRAKQLAAKTYELSEFLCRVLKVNRLAAAWPGTAVYHPSCQVARVLGIRSEPLDLLARVSGLELLELPDSEQCCGFGGTFAFDFPEVSEQLTAEKAAAVERTGAQFLISAEISCLMNIGGVLASRGSAVRPVHLAQVLAGKEV